MSLQKTKARTETAHVLISKKCVNDCLFCATADKRHSKQFPSSKQILEFIVRASQNNVPNMIFSGVGEPTLDNNFEKYLKAAGELGFATVRLFTNGYGLTLDRARRWQTHGLTDVLLSIHGLNKGHDCNVRRRGAFEDAITALKIYADLGLSIAINTCLTCYNLAEIRRLITYLSPYPIKIHTLAFPEWAGNALRHREYLINYEEIKAIAIDLIPADDGRTFFDNLPTCFAGSRTIESRGVADAFYLDGHGENNISPLERKLFHELCMNFKCNYYGRCAGFEKNYVAERGWGRIPEIIESFLDNMHRSSKQLPSVQSMPQMKATSRLRGAESRTALPSHYHKDRIMVVVRPTELCNAGCVYCSSYKSHAKPEMSLALVETLYHQLRDYAAQARIRHLTFLWHGGEPLLMTRDFFRRAWELGQSDNGMTINHLVQTNLLLIDAEWLELFRQFKVGLGTSVDPLDGIRILKDGRQQYQDWLEKLLLICESGQNIGIVFTATSRHLPLAEKIYAFFKNLQSLTPAAIGIKINPLYAAGKAALKNCADLAVRPESYGSFLAELWALWDNDDRPFPLSPFREWLEPEKLACEFSGRCQEHFLSIDGAGDIFNCARFADSGIRFGNILDEPLEQILKNAARLRLNEREALLRESDCKDCEIWDYCHGGCPYFAEIYRGDPVRASAFCAAYREFFKIKPIHRKAKVLAAC